MEKQSLILEGGGMRGLYTAGVLDLFLEENIDFPYCIAISAGACQGVSYISKQHKRNYRINTKYVKDKRYISVENLIKTGSLFGMKMLLETIPNELDPFDYEAFKQSPTIFKIGTTDCHTGLPVYYTIEDLREGYEAMQASISLPLVAPIVQYEDKHLLDGGIVDPIPIQKSIIDGNEKHVVVLTRHQGYEKKRISALPLIKRQYKKYPKLVEAMANRHEVYNKTLRDIEHLEKEGKCFVIRPMKPLDVSRFETNEKKLKALYDQGYQEAKDQCRQLKAFLER